MSSRLREWSSRASGHIDAAVTAGAVLSVVEPTMNGIGGDLFAIVYDPGAKRLAGLNARGRGRPRGHAVRSGTGMWGGFQGILIDPKSGVLLGGSDPRKDGLAIGF